MDPSESPRNFPSLTKNGMGFSGWQVVLGMVTGDEGWWTMEGEI